MRKLRTPPIIISNSYAQLCQCNGHTRYIPRQGRALMGYIGCPKDVGVDRLPHLLSACREMPVEAASEIMAISFSPVMNEFFSAMLMSFLASCVIRIKGQS